MKMTAIDFLAKKPNWFKRFFVKFVVIGCSYGYAPSQHSWFLARSVHGYIEDNWFIPYPFQSVQYKIRVQK
jgi:hypothetical protein